MMLSKEFVLKRIKQHLDLINSIQTQLLLYSNELESQSKILEAYQKIISISESDEVSSGDLLLIEAEMSKAIRDHFHVINSRYDLELDIPEQVDSVDFFNKVRNKIIERTDNAVPVTPYKPIYIVEKQLDLIYGSARNQRAVTFQKVEAIHNTMAQVKLVKLSEISAVVRDTTEVKEWVLAYEKQTKQANALIKDPHKNYQQSQKILRDININKRLATETELAELRKAWLQIQKNTIELTSLNSKRLELIEKITVFQDSYCITEEDLSVLAQEEAFAQSTLREQLTLFVTKLLSVAPEEPDARMEKVNGGILGLMESLSGSLKGCVNENCMIQWQAILTKGLHLDATKGSKSSAADADVSIRELMNHLFESLPKTGTVEKTPRTSIQLKQSISTLRQAIHHIEAYDINRTMNIYRKKQELNTRELQLVASRVEFNENFNTSIKKVTFLGKQLDANQQLIAYESTTFIKNLPQSSPESQKQKQKLINAIKEIDKLRNALVLLREEINSLTVPVSDSRIFETIDDLIVYEKEIGAEQQSHEELRERLQLIQNQINIKESEVRDVLNDTHEFISAFYQNMKQMLDNQMADTLNLNPYLNGEELNLISSDARTLQQSIGSQKQVLKSRNDVMQPLVLRDKLISDTDEEHNPSLTRAVFVESEYLGIMTRLDTLVKNTKVQMHEGLSCELKKQTILLADLQAKIEENELLKREEEPQFIIALNAEFKAQYNTALSAKIKLSNDLNSLDTLDTAIFSQRYQDICNESKQLDELIERANGTLKHISLGEIPAYKASVEIVEKVQVEFHRIFDKHLKALKAEERVAIQSINELNKTRGVLKFSKAQGLQLAKIDKRLPKLLTIYNDITRLNNRLIDKSQQPVSQENYVHELTNVVDTHLKQNVTQLSQGVNSRFVQWLRDLFKSISFGASKTETQAMAWSTAFFQKVGIDSAENQSPVAPAPKVGSSR